MIRNKHAFNVGMSVLAPNKTEALAILAYMLDEAEVVSIDEDWEIIEEIDLDKINELITKVAADMKVTVWDYENPAVREEHIYGMNEKDYEYQYHNRSFIVGSDLVILGTYDHPTIKLASFFHEVGHKQAWDTHREYYNNNIISNYEFERNAWIEGFKLAEKYGVEFDQDLHNWANAQIETYTNNK